MKRTRLNGVNWTLLLAVGGAGLGLACPALAQSGQASGTAAPSDAPYQQTTGDYNRRLEELDNQLSAGAAPSTPATRADYRPDYHADYRIGADDQLEITVLEAPELERAMRVSAGGKISFGLIGEVHAAGLTTRELELVIEELLRRNYIKEPHVSVQVRDMQSHPVAVFGAVKKPGVFQIRGPRTVIEILSMTEGLDVGAGDTVIIEHQSGVAAQPSTSAADGAHQDNGSLTSVSPARIEAASFSASPATPSDRVPAPVDSPAVVKIDLKKLLTTGDPRLDAMVYPGDAVKVPRAELVYVVGEVGRPGGFQLKTNENVSVLQAVAFAQGLTHTSSAAHAKIIRVDPITGKRQEIPLNLNQILAGKAADTVLEPRDIVFVPNSLGRVAFYRSMEAVASIGTGIAIYRP